MTHLILAGELDRTTAEHLRRCVAQVLHDSAPTVLEIDAGDLRFLDSSGLRSLLVCRAAAQAAGCRLVVRNPNRTPYQVLEITGLLEVFGLPADPALAVTTDRRPRALDKQQTNPPPTLEQLFAQTERIRMVARETREWAQATRARLPWLSQNRHPDERGTGAE